MINPNTKFLIVGLGLIGGSYAMGLKKAGYTVNAIEKDASSIDFALKNKIIDKGDVFDEDLLKTADIVVFCLYPNDMQDWILKNQIYFKPGTIFTDVSGVKSNIIDKIQNNLSVDLEFVSAHPMAGKESSGVQNSDDRIFIGANFIITPTQKNTQEAIDTIKYIANILKFKNIALLSPNEHDKMIGFVSQLTHAIAVSLMNCNDNTHLKEYTGDSFRDLTRIAKINENMWSELFFLNKDILICEIDDFTNELNNLKNMLKKDDKEGLKKLFVQSTIRRKEFDK